MIYSRRNNTKKIQFKIGIFTLIILLFLIFVMANSFKLYSKGYKKNNLFYVQLLNYGLPMMKVTTFQGDDMSESSTSFQRVLLKLIGLDLSNPLKLIGKEISFFYSVDLVKAQEPAVSNVQVNINPYSIVDNEVSKVRNASEGPSGGIKPGTGDNIPNNNVNVNDPKLKTELNTAKPAVFIYHSHTSESYLPGPPDNDDPAKNVCAVGAALTIELEKNYGISVVHDTTNHNTAYYDSYKRSGETIDKYIKKYGDFKLLIDIHRDSVFSKNTVTTKMNNENVAKFMFVTAKNNPHYSKNRAVIDTLKEISDRIFPGFSKDIFWYNNGSGGAFNQSKSNNAILIEVGADINTLEEAKASTKYLARIIAEYINGKR